MPPARVLDILWMKSRDFSVISGSLITADVARLTEEGGEYGGRGVQSSGTNISLFTLALVPLLWLSGSVRNVGRLQTCPSHTPTHFIIMYCFSFH